MKAVIQILNNGIQSNFKMKFYKFTTFDMNIFQIATVISIKLNTSITNSVGFFNKNIPFQIQYKLVKGTKILLGEFRKQ